MNLTEEILVKLDVWIDELDFIRGVLRTEPRHREELPLRALRQQVAKHTVGKTMVYETDVCNFCFLHTDGVEYPCRFIREVATDLKVEIVEAEQ